MLARAKDEQADNATDAMVPEGTAPVDNKDAIPTTDENKTMHAEAADDVVVAAEAPLEQHVEQIQQDEAIRDENNPDAIVTADRIQYFKTNEKILTLRSNCAAYKSEAQKLKAIADLDAKFTVPVIVNILIQIREKLIDEMKDEQGPQYLYNMNLLNRAIIIFATTDEVQNYKSDKAKLDYIGNMLAKADADYDAAEKVFNEINARWLAADEDGKAAIKAERDEAEALMKKYENPFHEVDRLARDSAGVTPTFGTVDLWDELATWMEGLYRRTADRIPVDKKDAEGIPVKTEKAGYAVKAIWRAKGIPERRREGTFYALTGDVEDSAIYTLYATSKAGISFGYLAAAVNTRKSTKAFRLANPLMGLKAAPGLRSGSLPNLIEDKPTFSTELHDGRYFTTFRFPKKYSEYTYIFNGIVDNIFTNRMGFLLAQNSHLDDSARIRDFSAKLKSLTASQKICIENCVVSARQQLQIYLNPNSYSAYSLFYIFGDWLPLSFLFEKTNAEIAKKYLELLDVDKNPEAQDPVYVLQKMIELRLKLIEAKSTHLLGPITDFILRQANLVSDEKAMDDGAEPIDYKLEILRPDSTGATYFRVDFPEENYTEGQQCCEAVVDMFDNKVGLKLAKFMHDDTESRIQTFAKILDDGGLTLKQQLESSCIKFEIMAVAGSYINPTGYKAYNPIRTLGDWGFFRPFQKTHVDTANALIKDVCNSRDVHEQLKLTISAYLKVSGDSSKTFGPALAELLKSVMNQFIPRYAMSSKKEQKQEQKSSMRPGLY